MDSKSAAALLIDPLHAPEPSEETGLNANLSTATVPSNHSPSLSSNNPFRDRGSSISKNETLTHVRQTSRGSSIASSPRVSQFPNYRDQALGQLNDPGHDDVHGRSRRSSSLGERFPGDKSNQPLEILRSDSKKAHRSSHLRKGHIPGADSIDRLDLTLNDIPYHHEGPFDAALLSRNRDARTAPIAALQESNAEALRATAPENIKDALEKHRPLDGVAAVPSGATDMLGRTLKYKEGENALVDDIEQAGGPHKWPGVDYSKGDTRGQGEPSYSLDRALQGQAIHEREFDGHRGMEMSDRPADRKAMDTRDPVEIAGDEGRYSDMQYAADNDAHHQVNRRGSLKAGLKKRINHIKQKGLDEWLP